MRALLLMFLCAQLTMAQDMRFGAHSAALGGQRTLVQDAAGTVFLNPAVLMSAPQWSFWATYLRPFQLPGLHSQAIAANLTARHVAIAAGAAQWGNLLYRERLLRMAFACPVTSRLVLGLAIQQRTVEIERYGRYGQWTGDFGARVRLSHRAELGILIRNAIYRRSASLQETPRREVMTGLVVSFPMHLRVFAELARETGFEPEFRLAVELRPISYLSLQAGSGFNTPEEFALGLSLNMAVFRLHYAVTSHPVLPMTHVFALWFGSVP
ncbi:MAG: hypothetical protein Q9P90_07670 [candidate division KSB1 bacterium]|nr:hypothetical protein [candidate division KSB1 bacterium]